MEISDLSIAQFTTASSKGDVYVQFGFVPDFAIAFIGHDQTNPNIYFWANVVALDQWTVEKVLLLTGSSGIVTVVTTGDATIAAYAGGDIISLRDTDGLRLLNGATTGEYFNETTASSPKHVDQHGLCISSLAASLGTGSASITGSSTYTTQAGLLISDNIQTNSAKNLILAFRRNR